MVMKINEDPDADIDIALGLACDHKYMSKSRCWGQGTELTLTSRSRATGTLISKTNLLVDFSQCASPFGKNAAKTAQKLGRFFR